MATMGIGAARRRPLPQPSGRIHLTDAGLETSLIHDDGLELQDFATIALLDSEAGRAALTAYFERYARIATRHRAGLVLETPTWRVSPDWLEKQGHDAGDVTRLNELAVALVADVRQRFETEAVPILISGCIGPRFDGYAPSRYQSVAEAQAYHAPQVRAFAGSAADLVSGLTMTSADEATGIALAAREADVPVVLSFTVETDGRLPDGTSLAAAVAAVDAATDTYPAYYMVNCAYPTHFSDAVAGVDRIRGVRANASRLSHAELDEAETLDSGDPVELAELYTELRAADPAIVVYGGCCGTGERHIAAIAEALVPVDGPVPDS